MKWKNLFSIILINIFLLCLVSLFDEYDSMREKIQRLDATFDLAVDSALSSSMASEELFSDDFLNKISSQGFAKNGSNTRYLESQTKIFRNGNWVVGNTYIMAMYYEQCGTFPTSQHLYDVFERGIDTTDIYEWLFGGSGSDYHHASLNWANKSTASVTTNTNRTATNKFKSFYNSVGKELTLKYMVKQKVSGNNSYTIDSSCTVPTLTLMGLKLNNFNEVTSTKTADNFTSSLHKGKNNSAYYLTPYSLGVTYVPVEVLKPTVLSHLEQMIRFSKCKQSPTSGSMSSILTAYKSADGCIPNSMLRATGNASTTTGLYVNSSGNASTTELDHRYYDTKSYVAGVSNILNDGQIEYDMSTLQVKVDYFVVDFYNNANYKIVNYIEGSTPSSGNDTQARQNILTLPERLAATDTARSNNASGKRIVAKVTVKMKIHIPYESSVLTWLTSKYSTKSNEHYDVKLWSPQTNSIVSNYDGLWYQYSTYTAIAR